MGTGNSTTASYKKRHGITEASKLPNGAVAFTTDIMGRDRTYYESDAGIVMVANSVGSTDYGLPATEARGLTLREFYDLSVNAGANVETISARRAANNNEVARTVREETSAQIAQAEVQPSAGRTGTRNSELVYRPRRSR